MIVYDRVPARLGAYQPDGSLLEQVDPCRVAASQERAVVLRVRGGRPEVIYEGELVGLWHVGSLDVLKLSTGACLEVSKGAGCGSCGSPLRRLNVRSFL